MLFRSSDEEKLGLRYRDIHNYLRLGTSGDPETDEKIRRKEAANLHKRRMPIVLRKGHNEAEWMKEKGWRECPPPHPSCPSREIGASHLLLKEKARHRRTLAS